MPLVETSALVEASPPAVMACLARVSTWAELTRGRLALQSADTILVPGAAVHGELDLGTARHQWDGVVETTRADLIRIEAQMAGRHLEITVGVRVDGDRCRLRIGIETGMVGTLRGSFRELQQVQALQSVVEQVIVGVRERTGRQQLAGTIDLRDRDVVA